MNPEQQQDVDSAMRRILAGNGDADIAEQSERLAKSMQELEQSALRVKAERDLALAALRLIVKFEAIACDMEARGMKDIARRTLLKLGE